MVLPAISDTQAVVCAVYCGTVSVVMAQATLVRCLNCIETCAQQTGFDLSSRIPPAPGSEAARAMLAHDACVLSECPIIGDFAKKFIALHTALLLTGGLYYGFRQVWMIPKDKRT